MSGDVYKLQLISYSKYLKHIRKLHEYYKEIIEARNLLRLFKQ